MEYELMRLKLSAVSTLEKAQLIVLIRRAWEAAQGKPIRRGGARLLKSPHGGFFLMVSEATGLSHSTVKNLWKIGSGIRADLAAALSLTPLAFQTKRLISIAKFSTEEQADLLKALQKGAEINDLLRSAQVVPDESDREFIRFIQTWRSLKPETRMRFLSTLANAA